MTIKVAIIGSGPSGFYTADSLIKSKSDVEIDIIDRLPTPFGLIRGGVAPDHQTTKKVAKAYEKIALNNSVNYFGNVEVGKDISIDELRKTYDAVVLAVGAPTDRKLGIPGDDKKGVYGSADFVGWYNGHPDFTNLNPNLNVKAVAVIGVGNVAIDAARVLVKTPNEMAATDIADHATQAINASPISDVYLFGRRGPVEAKFTNVELREMGKLENCMPIVHEDQIPEEVVGSWSERDQRLKERNLTTMREFLQVDPTTKSKNVHFEFFANPVEVLGNDRVEGLRVEKTMVKGGRALGTGEFFEIECGLVVAAIGYYSIPVKGVPFDNDNGIVKHIDGRIDEGVYAVGWIKRGPTGVIGTNKPDGVIAAKQIIEDTKESEKLGRIALTSMLKERNVRIVTYQDWQKIDEAEMTAASNQAPRKKFVTVKEMISALD
jgi:NADPH-dependent glutamate synthase beta subunit-like oxidoreductase|tara:strand:- start:3450 stop:4751 length:1302 start_codon:yes stop_codon:yes gene_type:complete